VIAHDQAAGISEGAQPKGPILATIPVNNPTSTTIFKALTCMKTRNPVIFSPHRGARKCVRETASILAGAARAAGAPPDAIQWITKSPREYLDRVMRHPRLAPILAPGTGAIVRMAQERPGSQCRLRCACISESARDGESQWKKRTVAQGTTAATIYRPVKTATMR
jgi:acyl-CoA reductase-like NAD-dependent aldehyde dehydrogenase